MIRVCDRAVINQGGPVTAPLLNVKIEGVVAGIQFTADKPTVKRLPAVV